MMKTTTRIAPALAGLVLALLVSTPNARAQDLGLRLGLTDDPDSFFFGGHLRFVGIAGVPRLAIEPSAELGFGEEELGGGVEIDYWTLRFNGNVKYIVPVGRGAAVYPVGGVSIYHLSIDDCEGDCDETEFGLNIGGGFDYKMVGIEFWLGIDDIPDFTLVGTLTF